MGDPHVLPARFTISEAAKQEIENIRADWDAKFADPADVVSISWAQWRPHQGDHWWGVVVSFYGCSQRDEIAHGIQAVSGLQVVFFTIPLYTPLFDGKVVDFNPGQGFCLRDP